MASARVQVRTQPGQTFGRWTVIAEEARIDGKWQTSVQCSCATIKTVQTTSLLAGHSRSCGCWCRELKVARKTTHGLSGTRLYASWAGARRRCTNPADEKYPDYGGRGITMFAPWVESYPPFHEYIMATLGERPSSTHSLDRIDNDRGYEPGNLRWATKQEQTRNRRPLARLRDMAGAA